MADIFNYISRDEFKQFIKHVDSLCTIVDRMSEAIDMYNHSCECDDINLNEIACLVITRYKLNAIRDKSLDLVSAIDVNFGEVLYDRLKSRFDDVCNSLDIYDESQEA